MIKNAGEVVKGKERPRHGRAIFYNRDSSGRHETTPGEYVRWAADICRRDGLAFTGTPEQIDEMIRGGTSAWGRDVFLDWDVAGNARLRPALDALFAEVDRDTTISHVFIPRRDRLSRPNNAEEGLELENRLRRKGVTVVFRDTVRGPLKRGQRAELGESIESTVAYHEAGRFRRELPIRR